MREFSDGSTGTSISSAETFSSSSTASCPASGRKSSSMTSYTRRAPTGTSSGNKAPRTRQRWLSIDSLRKAGAEGGREFGGSVGQVSRKGGFVSGSRSRLVPPRLGVSRTALNINVAKTSFGFYVSRNTVLQFHQRSTCRQVGMKERY